jgi:putative phage-type endonuclease
VNGVLIPTASEAGWHDARRKGVTASEIAVVIGLSPYDSPFSLYHRKLGNLPEQEDSMALAIGRHFEDFVAGRFAEQRQEFSVQGDGRQLYAHPYRPWQLATPDRIVSDIRFDFIDGVDDVIEEYEPYAVLECKTDGGFDGWGDDGTDEIPLHYRCQVLWQMDVMGVQTAFVACLFMNRRQLRVYEITLDDAAQADLKLMREEAETFLGRLREGTEPDVDWRPATRQALKQLHPELEDREVIIPRHLGTAYEAAVRRHELAGRRKDELANRVLAEVGDGRYVIEAETGRKVATRSVSKPKRIDTTKLRAEHPDIAAACTRSPKPEVRLIPARHASTARVIRPALTAASKEQS